MNVSENTSCLSSYGKMFLNPSARGKIKVQPTAVARKKKRNGSRQKQDSSRKRKLELPNRKIDVKRTHCLSKIIDMNQAPAKKAYPTKKIVCDKNYNQGKVKEHKKMKIL